MVQMVYTIKGEPLTSSIINPVPIVKAPVNNKPPITRVQLGKLTENMNIPSTIMRIKESREKCKNCG